MASTTEASRKPLGQEPILVRTEAVVVAEIENGRSYSMMRTPHGLVVCPDKDLEKTSKWEPVSSLKGFISTLENDDDFQVRTTCEPNSPAPFLERRVFGRDCFLRSEFDLKWNGKRKVVEVAGQTRDFSHLKVKS